MLPEHIVLAAIHHLPDNRIWTARNHSLIIHAICSTLGVKKVAGTNPQGFLTSRLRFVEREEGARVAIAAGQIDRLPYGTDLYSEWVIPQMNTKESYIIVSADTPKKLAEAVNARLAEGYKLYGPPLCNTERVALTSFTDTEGAEDHELVFHQPMVHGDGWRTIVA